MKQIRFKGEPGQAVQAVGELRRDGAEPSPGAVGGKGHELWRPAARRLPAKIRLSR